MRREGEEKEIKMCVIVYIPTLNDECNHVIHRSILKFFLKGKQMNDKRAC